jgi:hypothetical protein
MMLDSPHTLVPMLTRGNTPPTTRSPPRRSRLTGNPPNRQPTTVCEEELGGRGQTSRRTSMRVAPDCRQPLTAWHVSQTFTSTSHPPQQQDSDCHAVHRELCPGTGKGASTGVGRGQCRYATPHGLLRAASGPAPAVVRRSSSPT